MRKIGAQLRQLDLETGEPLGFIAQAARERVAPRLAIGEGGLCFGERFVRDCERGFGRCKIFAREKLAFRIIGAHLAELGGFRIEACEHRGGIFDQRLFTGEIGIHLGEPAFEFGEPVLCALFLAVEGFAGEDELLQLACGRLLGLAQRRQLMRGDRLQPRRLGLAPRFFGDGEKIGLQLAFGPGQRIPRLAMVDERMQRRLPAYICGEPAIARRLPCLAFQRIDLGFNLLQHIFEAQEIILRALETKLGFVPARVEPGDACGLFEDAAACLRFHGDDLADRALPHDGGRARAARGVGEQQLHIARPNLTAIDAIGRAFVTLDPAADLEDLGIIESGGRGAVGIVENEADLGHVASRPFAAAGEDHIVHICAAQSLRRILAHDPAHGIDKIGFAAAIRPDDPGQPGFDQEIGRLDEGLEAGEVKPGEFHGAALMLRNPRLRAFGSSSNAQYQATATKAKAADWVPARRRLRRDRGPERKAQRRFFCVKPEFSGAVGLVAARPHQRGGPP